MKSMLAIFLAALAVIGGAPALATAPDTFTGVLAGYTQGGASVPTDTAVHTLATGGAGACTKTITFSYNGLAGDTFAGIGGEGLVVTSGRDYVTHFYLLVKDGAGRSVGANEWIEDDAWEQAGLVQGVAPTMSHTATVTGACGTWTFTVDAHRGAGEYKIEIA